VTEPTEQKPKRRFLTKKEVARRLEVSPRTVGRLVREGKLVRPMWIGDRPKWLEADIEAYLHLLARGYFRPWPPKVRTEQKEPRQKPAK
jgi:excisionase family DNA binding protein